MFPIQSKLTEDGGFTQVFGPTFPSGTSIGSIAGVPWNKPSWANMLSFTCIGSGGAGGAGTTGALGSSRGGGGGGGSSGVSSLVIPAWAVPDTLYIYVPFGGVNGTGAGGAGDRSWVSIVPQGTTSRDAQNTLLISGAAGAGGGSQASGGGSGGTAGTVAVAATHCRRASVGQFFAIAGMAGGTGSTGVGGAISFASTVLQNTAGAGGGGVTTGNVNSAGGAINSSSIWEFEGVPGGVAGGQPGGSFQWLNGLGLPIIGTGGSGGGGGGFTADAIGGTGSFGCGGGGGGGNTGAGANTPGGRGGDGLVVIVAW